MVEDWLSVTEAAELVGYHPDHLRRVIRAGKVKARKFVTVWQVERESLLSYIRKVEKTGAKRGPKK